MPGLPLPTRTRVTPPRSIPRSVSAQHGSKPTERLLRRKRRTLPALRVRTLPWAICRGLCALVANRSTGCGVSGGLQKPPQPHGRHREKEKFEVSL